MNTTILTITGSDGTGGSGVQADIRLGVETFEVRQLAD